PRGRYSDSRHLPIAGSWGRSVTPAATRFPPLDGLSRGLRHAPGIWNAGLRARLSPGISRSAWIRAGIRAATGVHAAGIRDAADGARVWDAAASAPLSAASRWSRRRGAPDSASRSVADWRPGARATPGGASGGRRSARRHTPGDQTV